MAKFNRNKFLDALLQGPGVVSPSLDTNIAQFMSAYQFGVPDPTEVAIQAAKEQAAAEQEGGILREGGVLSNTFGWMASLGTGVENIIQDVIDAPEQGFGQTAKDIGNDVGAALAHVLQPAAEIAALPGVEMPGGDLGTDQLSKYVQKHGVRHHGDGYMTGQRLAKQLPEWAFGLPGKNKVTEAATGFGLDVATDPLSYVGLGLFSKAKPAAETLEALAAGTAKVPQIATPAPIGNTAPFVKPTAGPSKIDLGPGPSYQGAQSITGQKLLPTPTAPPVAASPMLHAVTNPPPISLSEKIIGDALNFDNITPETSNWIKGQALTDRRLYEKLRPVVFPEKNVPAPRTDLRKAQVDEGYQKGVDAVDNIRAVDSPFDMPDLGPISRAEQVDLFNQVSKHGVMGPVYRNGELMGDDTLDVMAAKYRWAGFERAMIEAGYQFPEGRLSHYLQSTKTPKLDEFAVGKPLKERPKVDDPIELKSVDEIWAGSKGINPADVQKAISEQELNRLMGGVNPRTREDIPLPDSEFLTDLARQGAITQKKLLGSSAMRRRDLNPANQAQLFNRMQNDLKGWVAKNKAFQKGKKWRQTQALAMMKAAEDYLAKTYGIQGVDWNGAPLRFTDVIAEIGEEGLNDFIPRLMKAFQSGDLSKITDPVAKKAIADAMARRAEVSGGIAKVVFNEYIKDFNYARDVLSPQKLQAWRNGEALKKAERDARLMGATEKEKDAIVDLLKNHIDTTNLERAELDRLFDELGESVIRGIQKGQLDRKLIKSTYHAIARLRGETAEQIAHDVTGNRALDFFMNNMTTWWGRGEYKDFTREVYQFAEDYARARAKWFSDKLTNYSKAERNAAFRYAQRLHEAPARAFAKGLSKDEQEAIALTEKGFSDREIELGNQIRDYFENILGSKSSLASITDAAGSAAIRSQMTMADIDKQLRAFNSSFQFHKHIRKTANREGMPADYSGENWLAAWENVDPSVHGQDPLSFLYDLDLAVQRVMAEYATIDSFAYTFGRKAGDAGFDPLVHKAKIEHHRFDPDLRFDPEVQKQFMRLMKDIEEGPWIPGSKAGQFYTKGLRMWKTGVTIYSPSHHIRNLIGDTWLMWAAGHNDPRAFVWSKKMLHAERSRYKEAIKDPTLDALRGLYSKEELGYFRTTGDTVVLKRNGANLTASEIYGEANQRGLLLDATRVEDIMGTTVQETLTGRSPLKIQPLGGHAHNVATKVAEYREHYVRLAHFSSAVNKRLTKNVAARLRAAEGSPVARKEIMDEIYRKAASEVRKWHPDGRDMTHFEQKWMRNIIPFYSWQRKSVPLLFQTMAQRPSKILMYPRATFAAQQSLGIEAESPYDPFPYDQLFPDWMRAGGIGPIGDPQSDNVVSKFFGRLGRYAETPQGDPVGYSVVNPGNPFNDFVNHTFGIGDREAVAHGVSSPLTPLFNIPKEFLTGTTFSGAPIAESEGGQGYEAWTASQVPILSMFQRTLNLGEEQPEGVRGGPNRDALANLLFALGLQSTGPYIRGGQFDLEEALKREGVK
jgi:hypothetical protein